MGAEGCPRALRGVARGVVRVELGARGGKQRLESPAHLIRALQYLLETSLVFVDVLRVLQGELRLRDHAGEGRSQLMGHLGRKTLLPAQARGETVEQAVESRGELRELVVRLAERETAADVTLAPFGRL